MVRSRVLSLLLRGRRNKKGAWHKDVGHRNDEDMICMYYSSTRDRRARRIEGVCWWSGWVVLILSEDPLLKSICIERHIMIR